MSAKIVEKVSDCFAYPIRIYHPAPFHQFYGSTRLDACPSYLDAKYLSLHPPTLSTRPKHYHSFPEYCSLTILLSHPHESFLDRTLRKIQHVLNNRVPWRYTRRLGVHFLPIRARTATIATTVSARPICSQGLLEIPESRY